MTIRWSGRRLIGSALILLLLAAGAAVIAIEWRGGGEASGVAVHRVRRGAFVRRASASGWLEAVQSTAISVPMRNWRSGYRIARLAEDGTPVRAGDVLVEFDPAEIERALADSEGERDSARSREEKAVAVSTAESRGLEDASRLARLEKDHAERFISQDESIFSRNEIIESSLDRDVAERRLSHSEWKIGRSGEQASAEIQIQRLQQKAAEVQIEVAKEGLSGLLIRAPHDGLFVLQRGWNGETLRPGDSVWPGQQVAEIPAMGAMEAKVHVLEADAAGLATGLRATARLVSRPEIEIPAEVRSVDSLAKRLVSDIPVQYFEAILTLRPPPGLEMKPGQRMTAVILLERNDGALAVPRQCVFEKDGRRVVYRREGGAFHEAEVSVERFGLASALIALGISEGDLLALRDPRAHETGSP